jgi:nucleoside-diphosphate-sugar epimerase
MKKKFRKVLITGGAGYVGSTLVGLLLQKGYLVQVFDSLRYGPVGIIPFFADKNFEFVRGDVRDRKALGHSLKNVEAVIHLAAIVGYPACRKEPELSRNINVEGTRNLVAAVRGKIPIIFASTSSTYGKMLEEICTETSPLNPLSDYGKQKAEAEEIIKKNKKFVIFRFATGFGVSPRMRFDLLPNDFALRAVQDRSLIVYEKYFMRTFIHVRDMARAFLFALENYPVMVGEIYNVGSNKMNYSKEDICGAIKKKVDYYLHFAEIGCDLDQRDYVVSYDKLEKLGFKTSVSMEEGIDELIRVSQIVDTQSPFSNV